MTMCACPHIEAYATTSRIAPTIHEVMATRPQSDDVTEGLSDLPDEAFIISDVQDERPDWRYRIAESSTKGSRFEYHDLSATFGYGGLTVIEVGPARENICIRLRHRSTHTLPLIGGSEAESSQVSSTVHECARIISRHDSFGDQENILPSGALYSAGTMRCKDPTPKEDIVHRIRPITASDSHTTDLMRAARAAVPTIRDFQTAYNHVHATIYDQSRAPEIAFILSQGDGQPKGTHRLLINTEGTAYEFRDRTHEFGYVGSTVIFGDHEPSSQGKRSCYRSIHSTISPVCGSEATLSQIGSTVRECTLRSFGAPPAHPVIRLTGSFSHPQELSESNIRVYPSVPNTKEYKAGNVIYIDELEIEGEATLHTTPTKSRTIVSAERARQRSLPSGTAAVCEILLSVVVALDPPLTQRTEATSHSASSSMIPHPSALPISVGSEAGQVPSTLPISIGSASPLSTLPLRHTSATTGVSLTLARLRDRIIAHAPRTAPHDAVSNPSVTGSSVGTSATPSDTGNHDWPVYVNACVPANKDIPIPMTLDKRELRLYEVILPRLSLAMPHVGLRSTKSVSRGHCTHRVE